MYTQCPECNSIFEITATDLAVAGGFVRCGECAVSFDALTSLSDNTESLSSPPAPSKAKAALKKGRPKKQPRKAKKGRFVTVATTEVDADPGDTVSAEAPDDQADVLLLDIDTESADADSESKSETAADTETGAEQAAVDDPDAVNQTAALPEDSRPARAVTAGPFDDDEILLDENYQPPMEADDEDFYEDEDELESALVASDGGDPDQDIDEERVFEEFIDDKSDVDPAAADTVAVVDAVETDKADESALFSLPLPELNTLEHPERGMLPEKLEGGEAACDPSAQTRIQHDTVTQSAGPVAETAASPAPAKATDAYDAEDARDLKDYLSAPINRVANAVYIGGSILMVLLLLGQFIHRNRGDLVIHPRVGPLVSSIYVRLGIDLQPNWQINDYKVVGQARLFLMPVEDNDEEEAEGATAIRFVTLITNGASLPQPAPMVRLTLRDRWGDATGMRDFTPPEYLPDRAMIGQMLEPGQRLRVVLNMHDLGADAVGFDFDMCLPDAAGTLRCASEDSI